MSASLARSLRALRLASPTPLRAAAPSVRPVQRFAGLPMDKRWASSEADAGASSRESAAPAESSGEVKTDAQRKAEASTTEASKGESSSSTAPKAAAASPSTPEIASSSTSASESSAPASELPSSTSSPADPELAEPPASSSSSSASSSAPAHAAPTSGSAPSSSSNSAAAADTWLPVLTYHPVPQPPASKLQHYHINFPHRLFAPPRPADRPETLAGAGGGAGGGDKREGQQAASAGLSPVEIKGLRRYVVRLGRVTQMTKKGKIASFTSLVVVGSPARGLVGVGWGRGNTVPKSNDSGFHKAVLNMDYVNRYDNRTVWSEMENKWGAVKVIMRPRPAGFGLMVPPALHRVFTACGIRDVSATIEGSRNPVEVVKCAIQMLHGGANPAGFGSGLRTGKGRREDKKAGMRSRDEIERERGRYGVDVGLRA